MKKWLKEMYAACLSGDKDAQRDAWQRVLKKSLKHKRTHTIK